MFPRYWGVMTNLTPEDLEAADARCGKKYSSARAPMNAGEFARRLWRLYDAKGAMELGYQELLSDLGLHHPPCREHMRNAGFYALGTLAHTLGMGVKLIGGKGDRERESKRTRKGGTPQKVRVKRKRGMRLWRVIRRLFTIPGRVVRHGRRLHVELLGASAAVEAQFCRWFDRIARC